MKNMKTLRVKMVGLLATALILFSAFRADKPVVTIFMIGDSTMANKKIDGGNPERGWGMVLPGFFSEDIRIDNHAANGRSSKSFISEGRWEKVISKVIDMIIVCPDGLNSWYWDSPINPSYRYETYVSKELINLCRLCQEGC